MPGDKPSPENTFNVALATSKAAAQPEATGKGPPTPTQPEKPEPEAARRRDETAKAVRGVPDPAG